MSRAASKSFLKTIVKARDTKRERDAVESAVAFERECCARLCERFAASQSGMPGAILSTGAALTLAAAIRARGGK